MNITKITPTGRHTKQTHMSLRVISKGTINNEVMYVRCDGWDADNHLAAVFEFSREEIAQLHAATFKG